MQTVNLYVTQRDLYVNKRVSTQNKTLRSMVFTYNLGILLTSLTRQWGDLAPKSIVLTGGIPGTNKRISVTTIEDTSCTVLDVCLGA